MHQEPITLTELAKPVTEGKEGRKAADGAPLIEQSNGGALKVGGAHKRAGGTKGLTNLVKERTRGDVLKRIVAMKRIVDAFDKQLRDGMKRGSIELMPKSKQMVTAKDAIAALNVLIDLSGLRVVKVAETDADGEEKHVLDERALEALLASRCRLN